MTSTTPARGPHTEAGFDLSDLDRADRLLLGGSAVAWLLALGAAVAATVALVDRGTGRTEAGHSGTPWFLYVVIVLSAVVIAAAVPLLLRARRDSRRQRPETAPDEAADAPGPGLRPRMEAPTEKFRAPSVDDGRQGGLSRALLPPPGAQDSPEVNRAWLRCSAGIVGAMGVATVFGCAGTYAMAVDSDTVGWVLHGVAVALTVAMIGIPFYFLRELRVQPAD
jgi:hypothetical protein